ncbi:MAG: hypothetical protein LBD14_03580 [Puniceicoccales bacterium]|jgi:DNA polymerase-3 subunit delta'|nr:hypothetical protein [Puniceicoccales bacterium]
MSSTTATSSNPPAPPGTLDILLRAHANNRLPHAILLHGADPITLDATAATLASHILPPPNNDPANIPSHPDFHSLRPTNKMRRIGIDDTRAIIRQIQQTALSGPRKIAVIYDADRMAPESANTFLKTLEEPPPGTTILLLTTKPTHLLDTIRSRCHHFHIPPGPPAPPNPEWTAWLQALDAWLDHIVTPNATASTLVFTLYGLASRYTAHLHSPPSEPDDDATSTLSDEEKTARDTAALKNHRTKLLASLATHLLHHATRTPLDDTRARALHQSIAHIERTASLLETNLNDTAAIEHILLRLLRAWSATK